jgi:phosphoglycerate dehydrogenase-like enzyme
MGELCQDSRPGQRGLEQIAQMPEQIATTSEPRDADQAMIAEVLAGTANIVSIAQLDADARAAVLRGASALIVGNFTKELRPHELPLLAHMKLVQLGPAGIDFLPIGMLPAGVPVASNAGAYAEPMAEHALAMALAAAKRLFFEHGELAQGRFHQQTLNRMLAGGVCGILGFGGVGIATARLMRCVGMRIHAINRRGATTEPVDWIGTQADLDTLLAAADVLLIATSLTRTTERLIGARELKRMKEDATLINVARGEIIDEAALYQHLQAHPRFTACIDAWWIEPVRHGRFQMDFPFAQLPNVIASPHNSASVAGSRASGLRHALENCRRALRGEPVLHLIGPDDRYL